MNFLGIYREPEYSPGRHASNDALILRLAGQALERLGVSVRLAELAEARLLWRQYDMVFSMCQGPAAVAELAQWKAQGALIVNDPAASRRTYRDNLCSTLREKELGFPHSVFMATDTDEFAVCESIFAQGSAWLKRADVHATQVGDVVRVDTLQALPAALQKFNARGLLTAVLQQHREGDEVKFYAVRGGPVPTVEQSTGGRDGSFFWPYYPKESQGFPFEEKKLKALAEHAAGALGIDIYGGDAIISPQGDITLIDLNDWPSFAPCRGAAASAIAHYLKDYFHAHERTKAAAR
jgi:hypothetical protein